MLENSQVSAYRNLHSLLPLLPPHQPRVTVLGEEQPGADGSGTPRGAFPLDGNAALPVPGAPWGGRESRDGPAKASLCASLRDNRIAFVYFYPTDRDTGKAIFAEGIQDSTLMDTVLDASVY